MARTKVQPAEASPPIRGMGKVPGRSRWAGVKRIPATCPWCLHTFTRYCNVVRHLAKNPCRQAPVKDKVAGQRPERAATEILMRLSASSPIVATVAPVQHTLHQSQPSQFQHPLIANVLAVWVPQPPHFPSQPLPALRPHVVFEAPPPPPPPPVFEPPQVFQEESPSTSMDWRTEEKWSTALEVRSPPVTIMEDFTPPQRSERMPPPAAAPGAALTRGQMMVHPRPSSSSSPAPAPAPAPNRPRKSTCSETGWRIDTVPLASGGEGDVYLAYRGETKIALKVWKRKEALAPGQKLRSNPPITLPEGQAQELLIYAILPTSNYVRGIVPLDLVRFSAAPHGLTRLIAPLELDSLPSSNSKRNCGPLCTAQSKSANQCDGCIKAYATREFGLHALQGSASGSHASTIRACKLTLKRILAFEYFPECMTSAFHGGRKFDFRTRLFAAEDLRTMHAKSCRLIRQCAEGLAHLHANRILHGDIKPGNMLATFEDDGSVRLVYSDFGHATFVARSLDDHALVNFYKGSYHRNPQKLRQSTKPDTSLVYMLGHGADPLTITDQRLSGPGFYLKGLLDRGGTDSYSAPECSLQTWLPGQRFYAECSDLYSLGVSLLEILSGVSVSRGKVDPLPDREPTKLEFDTTRHIQLLSDYTRLEKGQAKEFASIAMGEGTSYRERWSKAGAIAAVPPAVLAEIKLMFHWDITQRTTLPKLLAVLEQHM